MQWFCFIALDSVCLPDPPRYWARDDRSRRDAVSLVCRSME
jgi:hypothetical protein